MVSRKRIDNNLPLARKYNVLREENAFQDQSSRRTVSFQEEKMSKDKHSCIFLSQTGALAYFTLLKIF